MEVLKSGGVSNSEFLKLRVKIDSKRKLTSNFLLHTENFKVKSGIFLKKCFSLVLYLSVVVAVLKAGFLWRIEAILGLAAF